MSLNGVNELIRAIGDVSEARAADGIPRTCRIANIDPAYVGPPNTVLPSVLFEGESDLSLKTYQIINPYYTPSANDRVIMMPVGRTYVIVGPISTDLDTGWDSNAANFFTVGATHTINAAKARRVGGVAAVYLDITLGTTITVPANGDVTNTSIGTMTGVYVPSASAPNQPLLSSDRNVVIAGCVAPSGGVFVLSTVPGASLASAQRISLSGSYLL